MNTARLREFCDAFDKGVLQDEGMRELVALAREAADGADDMEVALAASAIVSRSTTMCECGHSAWSHFAGSGKCEVLLPSRCECQKVT